MKFKNIQISKFLNTDTYRIFPIPFKVMYISVDPVTCIGEPKFSLKNVFVFYICIYKTNAYLYGRWCFITAFLQVLITCHVKKL